MNKKFNFIALGVLFFAPNAFGQVLPSPKYNEVTTEKLIIPDSTKVCDTSEWTGYYTGTLGPLPKNYCTISSGKIDNKYPGLNGLGNEIGQSVPITNKTFMPMAQHLIQAKTTQDNNQQEHGIAVNFRNITGGGGLPQTQHNQKVGLSVFARAEPGGSNMWAINTDMSVMGGVGNYFAAGREADHTNFNGDYRPGGCADPCPTDPNHGKQINNVFWGDWLHFVGYPVTAGTYYSGYSNPNSFNMYNGILFASTSGQDTVGTGLIGSATINDSTNAHSTLKVYGRHDDTINTMDGTVARIITGKAGQQICLNNTTGCIVYDSSNNLLNFNDGKLLVGNSGIVTIGGSISAPSLPTVGGTVKGSLCVDTSGNIFVKTTPGSCL